MGIEGLQTRLVQRLVKILLRCQQLQQGHLDSLKARVGNVEARLNAVDPVRDEALFASHNSRSFTMPLDWKFEPCQGHYDTVSFASGIVVTMIKPKPGPNER